jgi:hypothetical protein
VFLYANINIGGSKRSVIAYPNYNIKENQSIVPINFKSCILSGLYDQIYFEESLKTSVFNIELYDELINNIVFTISNINEYNKLIQSTNQSDKRPATGNIISANKFLADTILNTLLTLKQKNTHGNSQFRLETFLDRAPDKILQFEKKRKGESITNDDTVTMKFDTNIPLLMAKPSKPGRSIHSVESLSIKESMATALIEEKSKVKYNSHILYINNYY